MYGTESQWFPSAVYKKDEKIEKFAYDISQHGQKIFEDFFWK